MKPGEELYSEVHQSLRLPQRAVLKPNLYHGRLDSSNFEARTSVDHQSKESEEYRETRGDSNSYRGTEDFGETRSGKKAFRIQGLPHSTVQKKDDSRRETVHQFETHPNCESLTGSLLKYNAKIACYIGQ